MAKHPHNAVSDAILEQFVNRHDLMGHHIKSAAAILVLLKQNATGDAQTDEFTIGHDKVMLILEAVHKAIDCADDQSDELRELITMDERYATQRRTAEERDGTDG